MTMEYYVFEISLGPGDSPIPYGPLSYANHTVTVEGISAFGIQKITYQSKILSDCPNWLL